MRKLIISLVLIALILPAASAAEYDGMTILHQAWYIDGTEHVIAADSSGQPWYYVDGVLCEGAGLVFVNGYYYYVRTQGNLAYDREYSITTSNDLLPVARYTFDTDGRMIDPPSMPEGWESEWFDSWPPPTEPTETVPPVTNPSDPDDPDALPTTPPIIGDLEPIPITWVPAVVSFLFNMISAPASWFLYVIEGSGMTGIFLAAFMVFMVVKTLLSPVLGSAGSDTAKRSRNKEE